jgi:hypothetical protein
LPEVIVTALAPCKTNCTPQPPDVADAVDAPPSSAEAPIKLPNAAEDGNENAENIESRGDKNVITDFAYELNRFNPLAQIVNLGYTIFTGHDSYDQKQSIPTALTNLASTIPAGRVASTLNLATDVGLTEIRRGIASTLANPNSMSHIFASKHNLNILISKAGSEANIIRRLYLSLGQSGSLPLSGTFEVSLNVYDQNVIVRGAMINGVPRIGTAFIP